jgi:hypothetical protein
MEAAVGILHHLAHRMQAPAHQHIFARTGIGDDGLEWSSGTLGGGAYRRAAAAGQQQDGSGGR